MTESKSTNIPAEEYKITEFDSSIALLVRVDYLLKQLHWSKQNTDGAFLTDDYYYRNFFMETIDELYSEGFTKFSDEERGECIKLAQSIDEVYRKYGRFNLSHHTILQNHKAVVNPHYVEGWSELWQLLKQYRLRVIYYLDKHNLLMKNTMDAMGRFRSGRL